LKITPLHKAVIEGHAEWTASLKDSGWNFCRDANGFTPLELAQLLGRRECQEILSKSNSITIKVQFKDEISPLVISLEEFEKIFKLIYRPFLTFPSYKALNEVICNCPYLLRFEWLANTDNKWEALYQEQLSIGATADTFIKWINPFIGYGLFADSDLPEKSFVGEYTGAVRRIHRDRPDLNAYCFHYPTRFWSLKYFVIDSLHEGNICRFINHSNQSNLQPLWLVNRGLLHLIFITKYRIPKGTQLTFDYGSDYWLHRTRRCTE